MSREAHILVFSDFPAEGEGVAQTIRKISDRPVRTVINPATAIELLATHPPDIVFAHLQAGSVAATAFLNEVWKRHPQAARFLLGDATPDSDALVRCALGPHQFIPGPINAESLATALTRADSIKRFLENDKIREVVSRMRTLPSRPALSIEIMRELRSAHASASVVGDMISRDVAISTKLIQIANSAFYRGDQQVSNPFDAVLLIGLETTAALVLSIETFTQLDKLKPLYFSMDQVWKHSQAVAELARKISQTMGCDQETSANVYTAGLLHDIGKIALALNFEEDYEKIPKEAAKQGISIPQAEEQLLGSSHAETGAYLLALWGLPFSIVEAVASHHRPPDKLAKEFSAATALHLADRMVNAADALNSETLNEILAEYPGDTGLLSKLSQFRILLGISKGGSAKQRKTTSLSSQPKNSLHANGAVTPAPQSRRAYYLALAATVAIISVALFYLWPRIAPSTNSQTQLRLDGARAASPVRAANQSEQSPDNNDGTAQPEPSPRSVSTEESTDAEPFPFDHLLPIEELSTPEIPDALDLEEATPEPAPASSL